VENKKVGEYLSCACYPCVVRMVDEGRNYIDCACEGEGETTYIDSRCSECPVKNSCDIGSNPEEYEDA
jgi:hypothetical protein